jgi:hypothetical protein
MDSKCTERHSILDKEEDGKETERKEESTNKGV